MERAGVGTAMLMLTALSVIAPAAEWISGSETSAVPESVVVSSKPNRSSRELLEVVNAYRETVVGETVDQRARSTNSEALRDPFGAPPVGIVVSPPAMQIALPTVELIGIIETPDGGIATLSIDGNIASLRVGESAQGVRLKKIAPPDAVACDVAGKIIIVRVQ